MGNTRSPGPSPQSALEAARRYQALETLSEPVRPPLPLPSDMRSTLMGAGARGEAGDLTTSISPPSIDSIPPQVSAGSQFTIDASGRIDLVPDPPDHANKTQRELYDEVRLKARTLSALGHNQLGDLAGPADRFLEAVPERIEDASVVRLWSRGNTLRLRLAAHGEAEASGEPTDPARLTPLVASGLRDVVQTFNAFIDGDARGRDLDRRSLGPEERGDALAAAEAAAPLVQAVAGSGIATPVAEGAITEQLAAARAASSSEVDEGRAAAVARNTLGNFFLKVVEEVKFAWEKGRAAAYGTGTVAGLGAVYWNRGEIIKFVVDNATQLKGFLDQVFHNPVLLQIIDAIAAASKNMPTF